MVLTMSAPILSNNNILITLLISLASLRFWDILCNFKRGYLMAKQRVNGEGNIGKRKDGR